MTLFLGVLFGAVGSGYVIYGKRQHDALFLVVGFVLIVYPYFIATPLLVVAIGLCLVALPILRAHGWF
ncbi:MAG: hypothetical protein DMF56_14315 [Acidobacteria bacterium]|nr:MAG: hypothetical protein DMF56_14315 [Acidobacteriota bacterium]